MWIPRHVTYMQLVTMTMSDVTRQRLWQFWSLGGTFFLHLEPKETSQDKHLTCAKTTDFPQPESCDCFWFHFVQSSDESFQTAIIRYFYLEESVLFLFWCIKKSSRFLLYLIYRATKCEIQLKQRPCLSSQPEMLPQHTNITAYGSYSTPTLFITG